MLSLVREFLRHVLPRVIKPLRVFWNEVIGLVFLALAVIPIPRTVRTWNELNENRESVFDLVLSAAFIVLMGAFGIHSFLRARKISRS
jgi:hypothetical protein